MTKHEKNQRRQNRKNKKLSRMASYNEQNNNGYNFELVHSSVPKGITFGEPKMETIKQVQAHYQAVKPLLNEVRVTEQTETTLNQETLENNDMNTEAQDTAQTEINTQSTSSSEAPSLWTALAVGTVAGGLAGGIGKGLEGIVKGAVVGAGASATVNHFLDTEYKYVAMTTAAVVAGGLTRLTPTIGSVKMGLTNEESETLVSEIFQEETIVEVASDDTL